MPTLSGLAVRKSFPDAKGVKTIVKTTKNLNTLIITPLLFLVLP
tara:strand:+ start:1302 stop:1433 length:132 start_codon:yes stop_codon:yes gene_type:complete